jgi:hypothetical protein
VDIFTTIGAPSILQSDNGREFTGQAGKSSELSEAEIVEIIDEIKQLWPQCKMVHGRPRKSTTQGGIERLNQTVEKKLFHWMTENSSKQWSVGCRFVRWQVNTTMTRATNQVPYEALTGQKPKVGISELPIAPHLLATLHTEEQLNSLLGPPSAGHVQTTIEELISTFLHCDVTLLR